MQQSSSPVVFISYSRADLGFVQTMAAHLRAQGCQTWIDVENLRPGDSWKAAIETALKAASAFALIVSRKSVESIWTSHELRLAQKAGIRIIPVLIETVDLSDLPPEVTSRQVLDLTAMPHRVMAGEAAMRVAEDFGLTPQRITPRPQPTAPLWIEMHPQGDSAPWHRLHEPGRPPGSWRLRLDVPFLPLRFDVLLGTTAHAPSATLLVPPGIAIADSTFAIAALAHHIGPQRLTVLTTPEQAVTLQAYATLAHARVLGVPNLSGQSATTVMT